MKICIWLNIFFICLKFLNFKSERFIFWGYQSVFYNIWYQYLPPFGDSLLIVENIFDKQIPKFLWLEVHQIFPLQLLFNSLFNKYLENIMSTKQDTRNKTENKTDLALPSQSLQHNEGDRQTEPRPL